MDLAELQTEACRGLSIEEAVFGTGIQIIGSRAFAECYDLQKVVIPAADVNIAEDAFLGCSCVTLTAPAGKIRLQKNLFYALTKNCLDIRR